VKHLILFHHDPVRTDDALDAIQEEARAWIHTQNRQMQCTAAYGGSSSISESNRQGIPDCRSSIRQRPGCAAHS
jgi:hypothetical protein